MPNQQPPLCTTASELVVREQAVSSIQLLRKRGRCLTKRARYTDRIRIRVHIVFSCPLGVHVDAVTG